MKRYKAENISKTSVLKRYFYNICTRMKPVVGLLSILYFLQGIPYGFQTKFLPVFLRSYSVSLTLISFTRLLSLPWLLKPLWAPLVDKFGSKISWIKYNLFGMALCYLFATRLSDITVTVLVVACLNIMAATQDIAVDSVFVDQLNGAEVGLGNVAQVVGYKLGALFGGGVLGWFSSVYSWQQLFFLLFALYTISALLVCSPYFAKQILMGRKTYKDFEKMQTVGGISGGNMAETGQENRTKVVKQFSWNDKETVLLRSEKKSGNTSDTVQDEGIATSKKAHCDSLQFATSSQTVLMAKLGFLKTYFNLYQDVLRSESTKWIILYVLLYKLGEQGFVAIFPLFLMDQGVSLSEAAFLSGVYCQFCSICGSLLGGMMFSTSSWESLLNALGNLSILRFLAALCLTCLGSLSSIKTSWILLVLFDCILHGLSGVITTLTFSLMVICSQKSSRHISATHFSTLATFEVLGKLLMVSASGALVDIVDFICFFQICTVFMFFPVILLRMKKRYR